MDEQLLKLVLKKNLMFGQILRKWFKPITFQHPNMDDDDDDDCRVQFFFWQISFRENDTQASDFTW